MNEKVKEAREEEKSTGQERSNNNKKWKHEAKWGKKIKSKYLKTKNKRHKNHQNHHNEMTLTLLISVFRLMEILRN
jgi:hypothetical protein